ncbi:MAG: cytochrome c3 family protein [Pirellulales bacterium]|nr:cytochrome c3 family protein [Pirellulales bacterium]
MSVFPLRRRRWPISAPALVVCAVILLLCGSLAEMTLVAGEGDEPSAGESPQPKAEAVAAGDVPPLVAPKNWPKDVPLPQENTNCVRCHLTAGRELTAAVKDFAHSVHDLNAMSCADCHGGRTDDDVHAHSEEDGFIGTKLSAHLAKCIECHTEQAELLDAGPHHWNWSERINTEYPMCVDCHGNHDVANPPADFKLADVCLDCHNDMAKEQPAWMAVVEHNDRLWASLVQVRQRNIGHTDVVPKGLAKEVDAVRQESMRLVHGVGALTPAAAKSHNEKSAALQKKLDEWLEQNR